MPLSRLVSRKARPSPEIKRKFGTPETAGKGRRSFARHDVEQARSRRGSFVVIGIAYALVAVWWKREEYRRMIARSASALIALSGLYWAALRIAG